MPSLRSDLGLEMQNSCALVKEERQSHARHVLKEWTEILLGHPMTRDALGFLRSQEIGYLGSPTSSVHLVVKVRVFEVTIYFVTSPLLVLDRKWQHKMGKKRPSADQLIQNLRI